MNEPDEFHGVGGSYTLDPKTGKRTRVEEPTRAAEVDTNLPADAPNDRSAAGRPGGRRIPPAAAASGD